eukprot:1177140-Prorocentrum_minimum.AAC.1
MPTGDVAGGGDDERRRAGDAGLPGPRDGADDLTVDNISSFYGSSCADNGEGALNTPDDLTVDIIPGDVAGGGDHERHRAGDAGLPGPRDGADASGAGARVRGEDGTP